jgi:hypothetical protein
MVCAIYRVNLPTTSAELFRRLAARFPPETAQDIFKFIKAQFVRAPFHAPALLGEKIAGELNGKFSVQKARMFLNMAQRVLRLMEKPVWARQYNWQRRKLERGNCGRCGKKCSGNPKTRKPFTHCEICRPKYNALMAGVVRRYRARKRARERLS